MRGQDLLESLGYIDDDLVADADEEVALSGGMGWKRWTALAACMVLAVVTVFVMSTQHPFGDDVILVPTESTDKSVNKTHGTSTSESSFTASSASQQTTGTTTATPQETSGITPSSTTRTYICILPGPSTSVTAPTGSVGSTTPTQSIHSSSSTLSTIPTMGKDVLDQLLGDYASMQTTQPIQTTETQIDGGSPPPYIDRSIGTYGKAVAVRIGGEDTTYISVDQTLTVAGVTVHIPAGWPLWLYQDGQFLTLSEAYEAGWITVTDVEEIHRQLNM